MKKDFIKKKFFLLLILIILSVGYAYLTSTLSINGTTEIKGNTWNIYFDNVQNKKGVEAKSIEITNNKQDIEFEIDLEKPGDYYEFNVDTVNDGTIDASIDTVLKETISEEYKDYLIFDATYADGTEVKECDTLKAGTRKTLLVKVIYRKDVENLAPEGTESLKYSINYVQETKCKTEEKLLCKRATTLHEEKYGKINEGSLNAGDAFDCDVNGDGLYDSENERFYYVSDYYDTKEKIFDDDIATLIYYNNTENGITKTYSTLPHSNLNGGYTGPSIAITHLPTTEQWKNVKLYNTKRDILDEDNVTKTVDFSYEGYAARLITFQEVDTGCEVNHELYSNGTLNSCNFFRENTICSVPYTYNEYRAPTGTWLETAYKNNTSHGFYLFCQQEYIDADFTWLTKQAGTRPVIDVPKDRLEKTNIIKKYKIKVDNERIKTPYKNQSAEGEKVILTDIENIYEIISFKLNGEKINGNSFIMPNEDVSITDIKLEEYNYKLCTNGVKRVSSSSYIGAHTTYSGSVRYENGEYIMNESIPFTVGEDNTTLVNKFFDSFSGIKYVTKVGENGGILEYLDISDGNCSTNKMYDIDLENNEDVKINNLNAYPYTMVKIETIYGYNEVESFEIDGEKVNGNKFVMPNHDVKIKNIKLKPIEFYTCEYGVKYTNGPTVGASIKYSSTISYKNNKYVLNEPINFVVGKDNKTLLHKFTTFGTAIESENVFYITKLDDSGNIAEYRSLQNNNYCTVEKTFDITLDDDGDVYLSYTKAHALSEIYIKSNSYKIVSFEMNGKKIEGNSFIMPSENVTISRIEKSQKEFKVCEIPENRTYTSGPGLGYTMYFSNSVSYDAESNQYVLVNPQTITLGDANTNILNKYSCFGPTSCSSLFVIKELSDNGDISKYGVALNGECAE